MKKTNKKIYNIKRYLIASIKFSFLLFIGLVTFIELGIKEKIIGFSIFGICCLLLYPIMILTLDIPIYHIINNDGITIKTIWKKIFIPKKDIILYVDVSSWYTLDTPVLDAIFMATELYYIEEPSEMNISIENRNILKRKCVTNALIKYNYKIKKI